MSSYAEQIRDISQSLQFASLRFSGQIERVQAELKFADQLVRARPDIAGQDVVVAAGRLVEQGLQASAVDVGELTARAEETLMPLSAVCKEYTLACVSHAHIDMNWMWSWPETVAVTHDTFQTMLVLMEEFPEFIFSQSQASTYELVELYDPAMFEVIQQRVREGRWEVTASQWVEGDKNMSSGESASRHLLYTRSYFADKFGLSPEDVQVDLEPDTFGHPATLPSILARGGVKYYYHCRGSRGPHLYWWVGPDGSRVLTFNDVQWYMCNIGPQIADALLEFSETISTKEMAVLYGVGDHGGGPTRRDLMRMREMNLWPIFPRLECSTLHGFFRRAEAAATKIPEVTGERNCVFTGCYTSQARQKWANRHGENLLYAAEAAATLGRRLADVPYPEANLATAWKHLLFDQFHDILPGSGVRDTRHYALGRAQESQAAASMARSNALRALSARIDTEHLRAGFAQGSVRVFKDDLESGRSMGGGVGFATGTGGESAFSVSQTSDRAFLVFNPLAHSRTEIVEVKLWDTELEESHLVVSGDGVEPRAVQVLDRGKYWGHTYVTVAFPVQVPSLGYRVVCVSDRGVELGVKSQAVTDPWGGTLGSWRLRDASDYSMENEFLRVQLNPASGGLVSLLDKQSGRQWVPDGEQAGILQYSIEANIGMSAWVIGQFMTQEDLLSGGVLKPVHKGPYVQSFRWTRSIGASTVELEIILRQGLPRVDFRLRVDWREMGDAERGIPNLRVRFPLDVRDPEPRYEIPFGSIRRDLFDGQEVPALRWVDLSEPDGQGVTLANSSKYGFSLDGQSLNMTLLRSSIEPDPLPDMGEHVIEYSLIPHGAGWGVGDSMSVGEETNIPLVALSCGFHAGELPAALSAVMVDDANVRLVALKMAQNDSQISGIVLRLVEVAGEATTARVRLAPEFLADSVGAVALDMMERPLEPNSARLEDGVLEVDLPAYGICTVRVG